MAERSLFWPDVNGDREYDDDDTAEFIGGVFTSGVYNGDLAVTAAGNMTVSVPIGRAYVGPAWRVRKYINDTVRTLTIANADGTLHRKDTIVLRSDINTRNITAQVLTGTFASTPIAPPIVRTAEQYDLKIAEIYIAAGTTAISQAMITDTRLDKTVCGLVTGVITQVDTSTLYAQIQADLAGFKSVNEADITALVASIKGILGADEAGNLLNLFNTHKADTTAHMTADQKTALTNAVPNSRKINNKALSADITLTPTDLGLGNVNNTADSQKSVNYASSAGSAPANGGNANYANTAGSAPANGGTSTYSNYARYSTGDVALTSAALRNEIILTSAPTSFLGVGVSADVIS